MPDKTAVLDGRPAPLDGCKCDICRVLNRRQRLDADLDANYARYLKGELVSNEDEE